MGSSPDEKDRLDVEGPETRVTLTRGFWLGAYPVSQIEYENLMGHNPSRLKGHPNAPVTDVSWDESLGYCKRLTELVGGSGWLPEGYEFCLPTEAQWEYACRAGSRTPYFFGDRESDLHRYAWYNEDRRNGTTKPVGQKEPNAWGLHDMYGLVWEWCHDWCARYAGGSAVDPQGPSGGTHRVVRGAAWCSYAQYCRSACRSGQEPSYSDELLGFRLCLAPAH